MPSELKFLLHSNDWSYGNRNVIQTIIRYMRFQLEFVQKNHHSHLFGWNFKVVININFMHLFCFPMEFSRSSHQNTRILERSLLCRAILRSHWIKPSLFCTRLGSIKISESFKSNRNFLLENNWLHWLTIDRNAQSQGRDTNNFCFTNRLIKSFVQLDGMNQSYCARIWSWLRSTELVRPQTSVPCENKRLQALTI